MNEKNINLEDKTITDDQVKLIYNKLDSVDSNSKNNKLEEAKKETETINYNSINTIDSNNLGVPQNDSVNISAEDAEKIINAVHETDADYKSVLNQYDIPDNEAEEFFTLLSKYRNKKYIETKGLFNDLPNSLKTLANNMYKMANVEGVKISKDNIAKNLIESIINDAKLNKALDEFNEELNQVNIDTSKEYKMLMNEYIENMYKDIDKIEAEDPDKAEILKKIKKAFEDASNFTKELEYLDHTTNKKLEKALNRYKNECFYFNRKINSTDISLPDIDTLYPIIKRALPGYTEKQIKKFIITICKASATYNYDNIDELAYSYRSIENILAFRMSTADFTSDYAKEIFGKVSVVINKIIALEEV